MSESLYTDGFECGDSGKSSAKLVIRCNRNMGTTFEIVSIQALLRQARELLNGIVHHAETIQDLLGALFVDCLQ